MFVSLAGCNLHNTRYTIRTSFPTDHWFPEQQSVNINQIKNCLLTVFFFERK